MLSKHYTPEDLFKMPSNFYSLEEVGSHRGEVPSGVATEALLQGSAVRVTKLSVYPWLFIALFCNLIPRRKDVKRTVTGWIVFFISHFASCHVSKAPGFPVSRVGINNFKGILIFPKSLIINETSSTFLHLYLDIGNKWRQFLTKIE